MGIKIIIQFKNITKKFPGVLALKDVTFDIKAGSCHGIVGENGAGKSTLGKILAGIHPADSGEIIVDGESVRFTSPRHALSFGIGIVHQELAFCENMSVAENLCLDSLPSYGLFLYRHKMYERAKKLLEAIGVDIDVNACIGELPVSQQQLIQIAAAVGRGARLIIFDEPTSSLSGYEAERLFALIKRLQEHGVTSIYVSHRLEELFSLCDTITVLRDGKVVSTKPTRELSKDSLVEMMIGRTLQEYFPEHLESSLGMELLRVEGFWSPGKFKNISFSLKRGEVLGFAGLVGSGRTEIAKGLFGLDREARGNIYIEGKKISINTPAMAVRHGLGLVPEDRKRYGIVQSMNVRENMTFPILGRLSTFGWIHKWKERNMAEDFSRRLGVRAPGIDTIIASLSGGNQQKIVLARWLAANCRILILDEPTRGVDVGSKAEMHTLIDQAARQGSAVLLISSELPELINLSTRVIVLRGGEIAAEVPRGKASQETLMSFMAGV